MKMWQWLKGICRCSNQVVSSHLVTPLNYVCLIVPIFPWPATQCVNSSQLPIRISKVSIWLPKQFLLFSLVFFMILEQHAFLVLWINSLLNPAELKVTLHKAASKMYCKYFPLIFNRFVTKLLFNNIDKGSIDAMVMIYWWWRALQWKWWWWKWLTTKNTPIHSLPALCSPSQKIWLAISRV